MKNKKISPRNWLIGAAILFFPVAFLIYYILFCDWCVGIVFCDFWASAVLGCFSMIIWRKSRVGGIALGLFTMLILCLSLRYSTFLLIWGIAAFGAAISMRKGRRKSPIEILILLIFAVSGIFAFLQGSVLIYRMIRFRAIRPYEVKAIVMRQDERQVTVSEPEQLKKILSGLQKSFAYMRNHERRPQDWELIIQLENGEVFSIQAGSATSAYPDAVFINMLGSEYQSRALYRELKPLLWPD